MGEGSPKILRFGGNLGMEKLGIGDRGVPEFPEFPGIARNLEEVLSDEDCQNIFRVVFVSSRALASAAGKFLFQR